MSVSFSLKGADAMMEKLRAVSPRMRTRLLAAVRQEAEEIMQTSKDEYVPVDEGDLQASGRVDVEHDVDGVRATLSYGGGKLDGRALAIHEHPSKHSPPSWSRIRAKGGQFRKVRFSPDGRGPKYLEKPIKDASGGYLSRIGSRLQF